MQWFWRQNGCEAGRGTCALCALGLILLVFGDVIFLRASLAPIDYTDVLATTAAPRTVSWLPERAGRTILHGQGDTGAAAYQLEPAARFMAFCIWHAQSPYWDPYTATGSHGPETLVDLKFSPLVIVTAIFGGGSKAFSYVLVALYFWSAYSLLRALTAHLRLSMAAALAASALFFLNGFALGNLYTQIGQPYFLAPILLLALLIATAKPDPGTFALAVGANVLFLATTFFPTLVLVAIVVYGFTFSLRTSEAPHRWRYFLALHAAVLLVALALLSFLYIPIFAAYLTYLDTASQYAARVTPGISLVNLLSLFTPKHFWESYRATRLPPPASGDVYDPWVHHLGMVGPIIAVHAFSQSNRLVRWPIWVLGGCLLTAFGQIFGLFPFTLLDHLPFFNFVRNEYWPAMLVLALVLLTAYGFDAVRASKSFTLPCAALVGVIVCAYFAMGHHIDSLRTVSPMPTTASSGNKNSITISIDTPSGQSSALRGTVQFGGWALATTQRITKISIGVDGTEAGDAAYGARRDDVCHSYPGRPGCPNVGWNFWLDTTQFSSGRHKVTVTAYTPTGHLTQTRQFVNSNPWAPPYRAVFWIVLFFSLSLLIAARKPGLTRYAKLAILALLIIEGLFYMNNLRPYRSDRDEHLSPALAWLNQRVLDEAGSRILNIGRSGLFPNWGSALQIPQLGDLSSGELPWYREFFDKYIGRGLFLSLDNESTFLFSDASLSLAGVRYVVVERGISAAVMKLSAMDYKVVTQDSIRIVFENPHPMPRAFVVHDWSNSDPLTVHAGSERVELVSYTNTRIRLRCNLRTPGELVLIDSWHPHWTAEVGGKEVPVRKVYGAFRGIDLQPGENDVVFNYKSSALVAGETVTVSILVGFSTVLLIWRRRKLAGRKKDFPPARRTGD